MIRAAMSPPHERFNAYRQLGDTALVVSGLFAPHLDRAPVDVNYYVKMGGAAYSHASSLSSGGLFRVALSQLAIYFGKVVEVLTKLAERTTLPIKRDVGDLYERWMRNPDSAELQKRLIGQGLIPVLKLEAV